MQLFKLNRSVGGFRSGTIVIREPNIEYGYKGALTCTVIPQVGVLTPPIPVRATFPRSRLTFICETP